MKNKDLYAVLGVAKTADDKALKSAYRKLAKKYHPDMNPGDKDAEQKFKEATEAYNILSDKEKRKLYDQFGYAAFEQGAGGPGAQGAGSDPFGSFGGFRAESNGGHTYYYTGGNADDILQSLFGDLFGGGASSKGGGSSFRFHFGDGGFGGDYGAGRAGFGFEEPEADADVHFDAKIPFTVAALGGEVKVRILDETLMCKIPAGIQPGTKIRLRGKGLPKGGGGKERGDAYLAVQIEVPKNLTPAEKMKLQEFAALSERRADSRQRTTTGQRSAA